jgi:hypothetical protein
LQEGTYEPSQIRPIFISLLPVIKYYFSTLGSLCSTVYSLNLFYAAKSANGFFPELEEYVDSLEQQIPNVIPSKAPLIGVLVNYGNNYFSTEAFVAACATPNNQNGFLWANKNWTITAKMTSAGGPAYCQVTCAQT